MISLTAPFWLTYLFYRKIIQALSLSEKPGLLFAVAIGLSYIWLAMTVIAVIGLSGAVFSFDGEDGTAAICILALDLSMPVGFLVWFFLAVHRQFRLAEYRTYLRLHPDPKYQIWLQDILVATFALGVSLIVLINWCRYPLDSSPNIALIVYEVITEFVMFFAVLDVCRLSTRLNQNARDRAVFIFILMLISGIIPMPVFTALAWNVWRRAMFLSATARSQQTTP